MTKLRTSSEYFSPFEFFFFRSVPEPHLSFCMAHTRQTGISHVCTFSTNRKKKRWAKVLHKLKSLFAIIHLAKRSEHIEVFIEFWSSSIKTTFPPELQVLVDCLLFCNRRQNCISLKGEKKHEVYPNMIFRLQWQLVFGMTKNSDGNFVRGFFRAAPHEFALGGF